MKLDIKETPREFKAKKFTIKDYGKIFLDSDEMVSFVTNGGKEFDFAAKSWGFYATPSVNARLKNQGFKTALVVNENNQLYIMAVEKDKLAEFFEYLKDEQDNRVLCWLDEWLPSAESI